VVSVERPPPAAAGEPTPTPADCGPGVGGGDEISGVKFKPEKGSDRCPADTAPVRTVGSVEGSKPIAVPLLLVSSATLTSGSLGETGEGGVAGVELLLDPEELQPLDKTARVTNKDKNNCKRITNTILSGVPEVQIYGLVDLKRHFMVLKYQTLVLPQFNILKSLEL
jgi:hypothetical protein